MVIASRAKEAVPGNAEWDFFLCKGRMRRFSETYKEIERLDEGYDEARDMKEVVTVKDKENKR